MKSVKNLIMEWWYDNHILFDSVPDRVLYFGFDTDEIQILFRRGGIVKNTNEYMDCIRMEHLNTTDMLLVTDSQDVDALRNTSGIDSEKEFDGYFAKIKDGDYEEIWGFEGIIPYTYKNVFRLL